MPENYPTFAEAAANKAVIASANVPTLKSVARELHPATHAILKHFEYGHLPIHLAAVSKECHRLAHLMVETLPEGPELTMGLRKLLEAKDCLVRAALP